MSRMPNPVLVYQPEYQPKIWCTEIYSQSANPYSGEQKSVPRMPTSVLMYRNLFSEYKPKYFCTEICFQSANPQTDIQKSVLRVPSPILVCRNLFPDKTVVQKSVPEVIVPSTGVLESVSRVPSNWYTEIFY